MPARDDLEELHALAATIADDVSEYRQQRKERTDDLIRSRTETVMTAPVRRRRRHRGVAAASVGVLVLGAGIALAVVGQSQHQPPAHHPVTNQPEAGTPQAGGYAAGQSLTSAGRSADVFACLAAASTATRAAPPNEAASIRSAYISACMAGH